MRVLCECETRSRQVPIIAICNEEHSPKLRALVPKCLRLRFYRPRPWHLVPRLRCAHRHLETPLSRWSPVHHAVGCAAGGPCQAERETEGSPPQVNRILSASRVCARPWAVCTRQGDTSVTYRSPMSHTHQVDACVTHVIMYAQGHLRAGGLQADRGVCPHAHCEHWQRRHPLHGHHRHPQ